MPMHVFRLLVILFLISFTLACSKESGSIDPGPGDKNPYFPPVTNNDWATISPEALSWNTSELPGLYQYLEENGTRAFIILKDGSIAIEQYWGKNILGISDFNQNTQWYWASAGKTIMAFLIGIAQQEGDLDIHAKTSDYLGRGWTSMTTDKEDLITVRHQLTMSTGLEYLVGDQNCTLPSCLAYRADAGNQWYYHNAPYLLLKQVLSKATGVDYHSYTDTKLKNEIGMSGSWVGDEVESVYWSTARDMARFGLMILNRGKWQDKQIMTDHGYFDDMTNTSQDLNPSYGYLWWLNGKSSVIFPGLPFPVNTDLAPNAPEDLIAAAGKNGQFADVIPSENMVVIRMGEAPDGSLVPIEFHDEMWEKIMRVIGR